jgi:hypothetical protein
MAAKRSLPPIRRLATAIEHPSTSTSSSSSSSSAAALAQGFNLKAKSRKQELGAVRSNWLRHEVQEIFDAPLMETVFRAVSWEEGLSGLSGWERGWKVVKGGDEVLMLINRFFLSLSLLFPSSHSDLFDLHSSSTALSGDD